MLRTILINIFLNAALAIALNAGLSSCASHPTSRFGSEPNIDSRADGAAYTGGFTFSKDMPIRRNSDFNFYFKSCTRDDGKAYYSKTSYDCTMLPELP